MIYASAKRLFDITFSLVGLVALLPFIAVISAVIKAEDGGPVFYRGTRTGRDSIEFQMLKFRTMVVDAEKLGGSSTADDDPRITSIGKTLRKYKLDELPQLINVLKGDMSFVGPRALRPKEKEVYGTHEEINIEDIPGYKERLAVRPGLTGVAQVYLPTDALRKEKFQYDLSYIKNQSFLFDLKLIFLSFWITFRGKWESRGKKV